MSKYLKDKKVYYTVDMHSHWRGGIFTPEGLKSVAISFVDDKGEIKVFSSAKEACYWQGDMIEAFVLLVKCGFAPSQCYTETIVKETLKKQNLTLVECKKEND